MEKNTKKQIHVDVYTSFFFLKRYKRKTRSKRTEQMSIRRLCSGHKIEFYIQPYTRTLEGLGKIWH